MFELINKFADWATSSVGIDLNSRLGSSVSFFIEDTIKIFLLIYVMLFIVALFRKQLAPEKIKQYLSGKNKFFAYFLAVLLGIVTPFCSCSSIPIFITFIAAGLPFGICMAFLVSSPLISEVAAVLLLATPEAGLKACIGYISAGAVIAVIGGYLCDKFNLVRFVKHENNSHCHCHDEHHGIKEQIQSTIQYAASYAFSTVKGIWIYVILGLGVGALMHGYIPEEFFVKYLGAENIFAVPLAAIAGIPIYANHNSVLPIIQVFLMKGVPLGTTLVLLMSITAISLPELIMLNKVLNWKILGLFITYLIISFIIVGYLLNLII